MRKDGHYKILAASITLILALSVKNAQALEFEVNIDKAAKEAQTVSLETTEVTVVESTQGYGEGIEALFEPYSFEPSVKLLSELPETKLASQITRGGLSLAVARAMTSPSPNDPNLELKWNDMKFHIDNYNRSAVLDISTVKSYTNPDTGVKIDVKYRWVISIDTGGLRGGPITKHPFNYKYYARGDDIEIISFEIDDQPVKYFFDDGTINPLAKIYSPDNDDCIDIDVKYQLDGDGSITSPTPLQLNFCAGSCSGYLLAATK